jgi:hypothetical protein
MEVKRGGAGEKINEVAFQRAAEMHKVDHARVGVSEDE